MYQKTKQPGNKPPAPDTQAEERSFEARVRARAEEKPIKKTRSALLQIIKIRGFLIDERLRGRTSDDLAEILASEGINITPGTLRNYRAQIERATIALENEGKEKPSNADIHRMVNAMDKAARTSGASEAPGQYPNDTEVSKPAHVKPQNPQHTTVSSPTLQTNALTGSPIANDALTRKPYRKP